jgi:2-methylcitrate dehydratase PrpD
LDASQVSAALGLAVAQAAGPQANFGTMAKPLHAGFAAAAAVRATCLAKNGVVASDRAVDGPRGFMDLYGIDQRVDFFEEPSEDGSQPNRHSLVPKLFPNCFATHHAMTGLLRLRSQHSFAPGNVAGVSIEGNEGSYAALAKTLPRDEVEAKFSLEYATALILLDGSVGLNSFSQKTLSRDDVQMFMKRVSVSEKAGTGPLRMSRVQVTLDNGQRYETLVDGIEPVSRDMLVVKIRDCLSFAGAHVDADDFCAEVFGVADRSMTALFSAIQRVRNSVRKAVQVVA